MGYHSEIDIDRQTIGPVLSTDDAIMRARLIRLQLKLAEADTLSDALRDYTRSIFSSDEPYDHSKALSGRISAAVAIVEMMLEDLGGANV